MQDGAFGHYGARSAERYAAALKSFKARRAKKPTGLDKSNLLGLLAGQSPGRVPHFMSRKPETEVHGCFLRISGTCGA